jgi:small GTP-binding protein
MAEDILKYKVVLAGEGAVGKTTLINRFVTGSFSTDYKATIGVQIFSKKLFIKGQEVNLQIWDIAGQTLFRKFRTRFFANARGALLVFDLTVPASLYYLRQWISDIKQITKEIPFVLIGNKNDLTNLQAISAEDITEFLMKNNSDVKAYYDTSALTGENVEQSFHDLVRNMI